MGFSSTGEFSDVLTICRGLHDALIRMIEKCRWTNFTSLPSAVQGEQMGVSAGVSRLRSTTRQLTFLGAFIAAENG